MKVSIVLCGALVALSTGIVRAAPAPAATPYDIYAASHQAQTGLFTVWRSKGEVALELRPDQLNKDFLEMAVPVNGIGAGLFSGLTDLQGVRAIRFVRQDDKVAILFPSTRFYAKPGSPAARAVSAGTAPTVVGLGKIVAENAANGDIVFDASSFLDDVTDVADFLTLINGGGPGSAYRLDSQKSYFGESKAFPQNIILTANQTFSSSNPQADVFSITPDARNLQIAMQYNIAEIPQDDSYTPRLNDDRVGYFVNAHMDFSGDNTYSKDLNYIARWNIQPSDPSRSISPAKNPAVYYLSDTIPYKYRDPIRKALLTWNRAFEKIGISNAVVVKDQPNDPNFDPDDIRYSVVRWLAESQGGFAEAQLLYNPYTGEMIKSGIVIDSDLMRLGKFEYPAVVQPARRPGSMLEQSLGGEDFLENAQLNYGFGTVALQLMGDYPSSQTFDDEYLRSIVLHESGHNWGLRHNYLGSQAYTSKELQNPAFTAQYGVASSVMEYAPTNIWPKGTGQGNYFQTVLGPYDYHAIQYGYARIPGARTPQAELPTLRRWASVWNNPRYAYASDEDVQWGSGAAVDPRNQQWDLGSDNIGWCQSQMSLARRLMRNVDARFPRSELPFDDLRSAFGYLTGDYGRCTQIVGRYIGGEYVSRALRGDRGSRVPLSEIPIATQKRAFAVLESDLFSAAAWNLSPMLLRQMVTQYRFDDWLGNLPPRHDVAIEQVAAINQVRVLNRMFSPVTLQRLDDMDLKYRPGTTMDLGDLFTWLQRAIYSDIGRSSIPLVRRNLQRNYTAILSQITNAPAQGTPPDAQALARHELSVLHGTLRSALAGGVPDLLTRAHYEAMDADVERALGARTVIPLAGMR